MHGSTIHRLAVGYALLGLVVVGVLFADVKVMTLPPAPPKHPAVKADLGDLAFRKMAQEYIVRTATSQGLVVTSSKVVRVKAGKKPSERIVRVRLESDAGVFVIDVVMSKSVWSAVDFNVVSQKPPGRSQ